MINVTQNKELILSPFCYSAKVFADDLVRKLEQHGYKFTISEAPTGITVKWTEYSSIGYDEEFLKERRNALEKYLNEDEPQTTDYCDVCNHKGCDNCIADGSNPYCVPSHYEPKDEQKTQTETQNSNLTFEKRTMRDCYNCKKYETEGECIECHYEPKDECAKEYEELGLKELKELIKADRKTEPTISKMEQVDKDINVRSKDEPQTMLNDGTLVINVEDATKVSRVLVGDDKNRGDLYYPDDEDEPQTDRPWK